MKNPFKKKDSDLPKAVKLREDSRRIVGSMTEAIKVSDCENALRVMFVSNQCLKVMKLHPKAVIPKYQTRYSSGFDVHSIEDVTFAPGGTGLVRTGLAFELPCSTELQVRQRSGISLRYPNYINNAPGTIDEDYRGELIILINNNNMFDNFTIHIGDRIAQCIVSPVIRGVIEEVKELPETERGDGGFGHTGK
jgi:dUTP pyrophosphatase